MGKNSICKKRKTKNTKWGKTPFVKMKRKREANQKNQQAIWLTILHQYPKSSALSYDCMNDQKDTVKSVLGMITGSKIIPSSRASNDIPHRPYCTTEEIESSAMEEID